MSASVADVVKDVDAALTENKAEVEKVAEVLGVKDSAEVVEKAEAAVEKVEAAVEKAEGVVADAEIVATQAKGFLAKLFVCLRPKAD